MDSSLKRENFETEGIWREMVRASANTEFCKTNEGVCPLYTFLNNGVVVACDCPKTRLKLGFVPCDDKTLVCPVRHVGWPEYSVEQIARYVAQSGAR